jgi:hypothetical protein
MADEVDVSHGAIMRRIRNNEGLKDGMEGVKI